MAQRVDTRPRRRRPADQGGHSDPARPPSPSERPQGCPIPGDTARRTRGRRQSGWLACPDRAPVHGWRTGSIVERLRYWRCNGDRSWSCVCKHASAKSRRWMNRPRPPSDNGIGEPTSGGAAPVPKLGLVRNAGQRRLRLATPFAPFSWSCVKWLPETPRASARSMRSTSGLGAMHKCRRPGQPASSSPIRGQSIRCACL